GGIGPAIAAALALMIVVAALLYMLGNLFRREEYVEMSKRELYNVAVTITLAFMFTGIVAFANEASCSASSDGKPIFDTAIAGMNKVMYGELYPMLRSLFQIMLEISALSNFSMQLIGAKFQPLAGFRYLYTSLNVVSFIMESMFASLYLQSMLLVLLKSTAMTIVFPIGIFLRTFPLLRDAGTFLMVVAFSFYTVFPYIYVASLGIVDNVKDKMTYEKITEEFGHSYDSCSGLETAACYLFLASKKFEDASFWALTAANYTSIRNMFVSIGNHIFLGVVMPALAVILSVAMSQSIIRFIKEVTS
ncbi:MAG: hypothetical protein N3H30_00980, partial [Candidatus Micrarchaeota archaeon]|nr:hypothetical protein [Candidatus Micrarchaeota archaeon]